jgi:Signal transduction histidine kinase regulating citrate/malate metabolism
MRIIPNAVALSMLAFNLMMEYGTLTRRRSVTVDVVVRALSVVASFLISLLWTRLGLESETYLRQGVSSLGYYLACLFLFRESFAQKTFLYFMDFSATSFVASICAWIASILPWEADEYAIQSALFVLCLLSLLPLYFRFVRSRVREMLSLFRQSKPFYAAFPFLTFVYFSASFGPVNAPESFSWLALMLLYVGSVVLAYYLLFSHFHSVFDRLKAEDGLTRAEQQLKLHKKYYEELDRGIQAQRALLHDTRHHLVAIGAMAKSGDLAEIERYVDRLLASYDSEGLARCCENHVANAVIGGYVKVARAKGIAVATDLELPQDLGIDDYELCVLFGNTIENAIEACDRIPAGTDLWAGRKIEIKSRVRKGQLVVYIENSAASDPSRKDPVYPSEKGSGIGLESVRHVVERHEGSMSCARRGESFAFSAVLCPARSDALGGVIGE